MGNLSRILRSAPILLAIAMLLTLSAPVAQANSVLFYVGPTMLGGFEVHASAQFDFDPTNHKITISLLNLETNPSNVTQALGSIRFTLTGAGAAPAPTIFSVQANTFGIDANGNPVADSETTNWRVSNIGGTQIVLCTTCAPEATPIW
jgi:hypothetical protein